MSSRLHLDVRLADHAGACYGVKRALALAEEAAKTGEYIQTLGPLIHNPQVVSKLQDAGVGVASAPEDVSAARVIVRSHGVTPDVYDALQEQKLEIIDATCPHVLKAQKAAYDLSLTGKTVVIVGEAEHPEVEGLQAWAQRGGGKVVVVSSAEELDADLSGEVGVVVQTTQARSVLDDVVAELNRRGLDIDVRNTICLSTSKRQKAICELAQNVDAMVIVGGKNSSNTTRLFELCKGILDKVYHVESPNELDIHDFQNVQSVGVGAGASTPDDQIIAVVDCLRTW